MAIHLSRCGTLDGFAAVAGELGLDPKALVAELGLPGVCLSNRDLRISTKTVRQLYQLAAERAGVDDFGLRVARLQHFSSLGAVGLIMREQANVGGALAALADHAWAQAEGLQFTIEAANELVIVRLTLEDYGLHSLRQSVELALGVLVVILRRFLGRQWRPEMVMFRHRKPAGMALHIAMFGNPPLFGQDIDALVLRAVDLATPIPDADTEIAAQLVNYLEFTAGRRNVNFTDTVCRTIDTMLATGQISADIVAHALGMDRRTMHRRLALEGTSFSALLQMQRTCLALAYIDAGSHSLTEIAELLGFSCLSAFSHWKKQALARLPAET